MKRILKWTLITIGIIVGVVILAWVGMFLKLKHETADFTPLETGRVVDDIYVVKDDFANVFFLRDSLGYVAVDAGMMPQRIAAQMDTLGISPADVHSVLLTHTDTDHIGALSLFPDAQLFMARPEEQMIDGTTPKKLWFGNMLPRKDYTLVDDRMPFQVGGLTVEGILAPGHTAGMTAWLIDDKYLFSGDIVALAYGKITAIPAFFDMDHTAAVASHALLRDLPAQYILTGHWGWADYATAIGEW